MSASFGRRERTVIAGDETAEMVSHADGSIGLALDDVWTRVRAGEIDLARFRGMDAGEFLSHVRSIVDGDR